MIGPKLCFKHRPPWNNNNAVSKVVGSNLAISYVGFFSPERIQRMAGNKMGPVKSLGAHTRTSLTSRMRLWRCCLTASPTLQLRQCWVLLNTGIFIARKEVCGPVRLSETETGPPQHHQPSSLSIILCPSFSGPSVVPFRPGKLCPGVPPRSFCG